jgi:hypothetical protein
MPVPFLLKVHSDDADLAAAIADALEAQLADRDAKYAVQTGPRGLPGACVSAGVWDAEGAPRWLTPLPVEESAEPAARKVVLFLESWGFIPRRAAAAPPRAA